MTYIDVVATNGAALILTLTSSTHQSLSLDQTTHHPAREFLPEQTEVIAYSIRAGQSLVTILGRNHLAQVCEDFL